MSQLIRSCLLWCLPALAAYPIQLLLMGMIVPTRLRRWWQYLLVSFGVCLFNVPKVIWGAYSLPADVFRLLAGPVVLVVIPVLLFAGPVWKRLLTNFILYCVQAAAEMLAFSLLRDPELLREGGAAFTTFAESASYTAVATLVYALFGGGAVILARSLQAKRFSGVYLPVAAILFSLFLTYYAYLSSASVLIWCVCCLLGCASALFLLYYVISLEKKAALEEELRDIHSQMELEQAHYRAVEARREELSRIRHDFNNQLAAIGLLMQSGSQADAQSMLQRLSADIAATREEPYCAVPVINAVLTEKEALCRARGIQLRTELALPEALAVEPLHLCSILSNLLDNAIHGCAETEEPVIVLSAATVGDYLFLRTVNPALPPQKPEKGHGFGSKILRELAERYDGGYETIYEGGRFTAVVSLLPKSEA